MFATCDLTKEVSGAEAVSAAAEALLRGERDAERRLRELLRDGYRQAGLSPIWYCELGLRIVYSEICAATPLPFRVQLLIRRLGHWLLYALAAASGHLRDTDGAKRWLDAISSDHRGFRQSTYELFRGAAKQLGWELEVFEQLVQARSVSCERSKQSVSPEERRRRAQWNHLLAADRFNALLVLWEERIAAGQRPTNQDLSMLLRAARTRAGRALLTEVVSRAASSVEHADAVLVQELLCAYRVLGLRDCAERLFETSIQNGMAPCGHHYTTLIALCADHDDRRAAECYVARFQATGLPIDPIARRAIRDARGRCTRKRPIHCPPVRVPAAS